MTTEIVKPLIFDNYQSFPADFECAENALFGDFCHFGPRSRFDKADVFSRGTVFGDDCVFANGTMFGRNSHFGNNCKFGDECRFADDTRFGMSPTFGVMARFNGLVSFSHEPKFAGFSKFSGFTMLRGPFMYRLHQFWDLATVTNLDGSRREINVLVSSRVEDCMIEAGYFWGTLDEFVRKSTFECKDAYAQVLPVLVNAKVEQLEKRFK